MATFYKEVQKQHEVLDALMKAFDDFIKRKLIEQYNSIFGETNSNEEEKKITRGHL